MQHHHLLSTMWTDHTGSLVPKVMRVQGRVVGKVTIKDIGRDIMYNEIVDLPEETIIGSKDIVHAYNNRWIDILVGRELMDGNPNYSTPTRHYSSHGQVKFSGNAPETKQAPQVAVPVPSLQLSNIADMLENFKSGLKETIRDIVREEVSQVKSNAPSAHVDHDQIAETVAQRISGMMPAGAAPRGDNSIPEIDKQSQNVFIGLDEKADLKSSMPEPDSGKVVESGSDASSAIKKLSRLKKIKGDS